MNDATGPGVPLGTPLYKEIKRQMMEALTGGEWKPGEAIPAERRLSERYGISIGTVRTSVPSLLYSAKPVRPLLSAAFERPVINIRPGIG